MKAKHLVREKFRNDVFKRDQYRCRMCGKKSSNTNLDAHHITDRNEILNGGYVRENGISLCTECHMKAERFHISKGKDHIVGFHPSDLYSKIGSSYEQAVLSSAKL